MPDIYTPIEKTSRILVMLQDADRLYLRIGLPGPWLNPNTGKVASWTQVTGIYTLPDYLEGKSFADFLV